MSVFFFGFYFLSVFLAGVAYGFEDYLSPNWELNFCWPRCPLILQELKTNLGGWSSGHVHGFLSGQEFLVVPDVVLILVE